MLSIDIIRRQTDKVREALARRGEEFPIDRVLEVDEKRRSLIQEIESMRARRNEASQAMSRMKERPQELVEEMREVGDRIKLMEGDLRQLEEEVNAVLLELPNLPEDDVPTGLGEEDNILVREWGEPRSFDFTPLPHWELGESLGIIDFQRGTRMAGSRFFILTGMGAKLERALISWMLDLHTTEHSYKEVYLPAIVKREIMEGSGNLPKFGDNLYHDEEDDLWLVPTAEVPLTSLHRQEILAAEALPLYYTAYTPCFRREKAAAGRDTRGIKRVHQFDKVEMYKFVEPEQSEPELQKLVHDAEDVCLKLELPYRVVQLCAGELGFASAKSYDLEMWAPGCEEWLEVSSCSNCTDFQARRSGIRYRPEGGGRPAFVHSLNGSGLALPRVVISILENFQQSDGTVVIPEVLRGYTGFDVITPA
ncbi:MAG: serine--tRNA ligase [Dehalococcoidia bacterium]|nr:serine--tRNA ligase [Dehalococcoidia bacterium]